MLLMNQSNQIKENEDIKNVLNQYNKIEIADFYNADNFTGAKFNPLKAKGTYAKSIKLISVDTGKAQTKAMFFETVKEIDENGAEVEKLSPKSVIIESIAGQQEDLDKLNDEDITTINGVKFSLRSGTDLTHVQTKELEQHRALAMEAVGKLVENGDVVDLVVGQPLNMYSNKESRKQFETFMRFGVEYSYNGIDVVEVQVADGGGRNLKTFYIREVMCAPETLSAVMTLGTRKEEFEFTASMIADLGGRNAQFLPLLRNLKPDSSAKFTSYNLGSIMLAKEIVNLVIAKEKDDTFKEDDVLMILEHKMKFGYHIQDESRKDIIEIVDKYICNVYLPELEKNMKKEGLNPTRTIIFTGGTSLLLKPYLEAFFGTENNGRGKYKMTFVTNPVFANCMGYATMGRKKMGKIING